MKGKWILILVALIALVGASDAAVAAPDPPPFWDISGTWTGYSGLVGNLVYHFTMTLTQDGTGHVTGTIAYDTGQHGSIEGDVSGDTFAFTRTDDAPSTYWATCDDCPIAWTAAGTFSFEGTGLDDSGDPYRFVGWQASGPASSLPAEVSDCAPGTYSGYSLVETLFVSAVGPGANTPVVTTTNLDPGISYLVEASGTYFAGGTGTFDIRADAEYSQDAYLRTLPSPVWTGSVHNYESYGEVLLDLMIDGENVEWGSYSADHVYDVLWLGAGDPMAFELQIYDIYGQNNTGGLCVAIYEPPSISLTPLEALNPVGTSHTVTALLDPAVSGFPVAFEVTGTNNGYGGSSTTDGSGEATFTYLGDGGAGEDSIGACADLDASGTCDAGEPYVTATKYWLEHYVTGGGRIDTGKGKEAAAITFAGTVGFDLQGSVVGQWQTVFHNVKNDTLDKGKFHSTSFESLLFGNVACADQEPDPPGADYNRAIFVAVGRFNGEDGWKLEVRMTDYGEPGNSWDTILLLLTDPGGSLVYASPYRPDLGWNGDFEPGFDPICHLSSRALLDGGNLQIHPPALP